MNGVIHKKSTTLCFYLYNIFRNKQIQGAEIQLNVALQLVMGESGVVVKCPEIYCGDNEQL